MQSGISRERERGRRSEGGHRGTVVGTDARRSTEGGTDANGRAADDFFERNVAANYLTESAKFDGFLYLLRPSDLPVASSLRSNLFPQLAQALEATLQRAALHQMSIESRGGGERRSISSAKGKQYRTRSYFPEGPISLSDKFDVIRVLAEELKRVHDEPTPPPS